MTQMIDDDDPEDGFVDLLRHLPPVSRPTHSLSIRRPHTEDDFQSWLVDRFDRVDTVRFRELFLTSLTSVLSNLTLYSFLYLGFLIFGFGFHWLSRPLVFEIWIALCSILSYVAVYGLQKRVSICVKSGLFLFANELISSFIHQRIVMALWKRSSSISFFLLLGLAWDFFLFFLPCLVFDGRRLNLIQLIRFSVKIVLLPGNAIQLIGLVFLEQTLFLIGPFTFGVSYWLGYSLRVAFYHQICGTSGPLPNHGV
jgi:hypothetical protein